MPLPDLALYAALAYIYQWSSRAGSFWMIMARLPATLVHELSHLITALLLSGRPTGFSLWPKRNGDAWQLGSVSCSNATWYNTFPVAMSPILLNLPLAWWLHGQSGIWFKVAAFAFLAGSIPSWQDLKVALSSLVGAAAWLAVIIGAVSHREAVQLAAYNILNLLR
ncbi:M50 family metallopeptidase (plasmid) [Trichlorobacter lovleyi]|uniref:M50 family metallopeptidase n=1 Tax=Trichlorobacter lovleyi TaxID=313985 RepID=UPI00223EB8C1|nr:M50 family metallopeptidase [Trichlorobacter lovleyi]QOX81034.1 M50 family metallopeptidase [Trichlorobacter lovleyi]